MNEYEAGLDLDNSAQERARAFLAFEDGAAAQCVGSGERVGEFTLGTEIGRGGMGVVFRARQVALDRDVAVKIIPLAPGRTSEQDVARIEREARLLAKLRHPSIVAVHAAGSARGYAWVAMDLVEGTTLRAMLSRQVVSGDACTKGGFSQQLELLRAIAAALGAAHRAGVVHRDVKPENVLVDAAGRPYLVDFGLARETEGQDVSATHGFVGTPRYASPEQLRGLPLCPRSDVFSFGALAFETVAGVAAFAGDTTAETLTAIAERDPAWPSGSRVPADLCAVIEHCLEKRPDDRYADAGEVEQEIARILRFEPVAAVRRGLVARAWRWLRRRPSRLAVAACALVMLLAVGGAAIFGARQFQSVGRLEGEARLTDARTRIRAGDLTEAARVLDALAEDEFATRDAAGLRADLFVFEGDWARARPLYARALALGSRSLADKTGAALTEGHIDAVTLAAGPAIETARDAAVLALAIENAGDATASLVELDRAVELEPTNYVWRTRRAALCERLGRRQAAVADLQVAREIRPNEVEPLRSLAAQLGALGRGAEQEALLRAALIAHGDQPRLLSDLAMCLHRWRRYETSAEVTSLSARAYELTPHDPWPIAVHAFVLQQEREFAAARTVLVSELERRNDDPVLLDRLAWVEIAAERFDAAATVANRLFALGDRNAQRRALPLLEQLAERAGRSDEALEHYQRLSELDPEDAQMHGNYGRLLLQCGRFDAAGAMLDRALALGSEEPETLTARAMVFRKSGRPREALPLYERALAAKPGDAGITYDIADVWYETGEPGAALHYAERAVATAPKWLEAWVLKSLSEQALERLDAAAQSYRSGLLGKESATVRADLADLLDRMGKDRESLAEYQRARVVDPLLPTTWCGEGLLRLDSDVPELRDVDAAVVLLEKALALAPGNAEYEAYLARARAAQTTAHGP